MLSECSFKIRRENQRWILQLWPFGFNDLNRLLAVCLARRESFLAVKHSRWADGFHPPSAKLVSARRVSQGLIAHSETTALVAALQKPGIDSVVDLKLFFPQRSVSTKANLALLEKHFESFDETAALKAWGGCWITVHDACKTYITLSQRSGMTSMFFKAILQMNGAQLERKDIAALCQRLYSLPDSQCLLLAWFRDVLRYRIENADVHNCEKVDELILWNR